MRGKGSSRRRRRLVRLLAPAIVVLYVIMIPLNSAFETDHAEIFPFFRWRLFAYVPDWQTHEYALIVDAVDGQVVDGTHYLIPNDSVRDWKALRVAAAACNTGVDCDDTVAEVIYPIIRRDSGDSSVEFRIVRARVDLRDVQDHISDLTEGETTVTDLFQPIKVLGRWNTSSS